MEARLTYPATIAADGIAVTHRTPTLALCRALVEAGRPDGPLTVADDKTGKPLLHVPSIHAAAGLTVTENASAGPRFAKWVPFAGIGGEE